MSATMIMTGILVWFALSIGGGIAIGIRRARRVQEIDESQLEGDLQNAVRDINFSSKSASQA